VRRRLASAALVAGCTIAACGTTRAVTPPPAEPTASTLPVSPREGIVGVAAVPAPGRYDINHVLSTGQSLAIGVGGRPPLTTEQPFANLMFKTGVMAGRDDLDELVPLVEGDNIPGTEVATETMSSAFANLASGLAREAGETHDILVSVHGAGAFPYFKLKKGSKPYTTGMMQVAAARDLAKKVGKSYVVRAITNLHGESDHAEKTTTYARDLTEWQADYEKDIRELTGQTEPVPMFHTQISNWTRMMKGTATSAIPLAQLAASVGSNGKIVMVGPKYHLPYNRDGVHLSNEGYRHAGEDYAKAYRRVVIEGGTWEPLRPVSVTRDGAVITVRFVVPSPPVVLDTELVSDPGSYGFEYTDAAGTSPRIVRVAVAAPDTVTITLASEPTAGDRRLRYAFTGTAGSRSGPATGARGNLRDSDPTRSRLGYPLYNWCVHFDEAVP
jgi:hypothetical protein